MSVLEKRFLAKPGRTVIETEEDKAQIFPFMKKGIVKGDFVLRVGLPTTHNFIIDLLW